MTTDMNFKIRPARANEWPVLADLHYRAYYDRFFDPQARGKDGVPYGAPLAREFPVLAKGQNEDYFRRYWEKFVRNFDNGLRARNYVFVAESEGRIVGFIKGSGKPLDGELKTLFNAASLGDNPDPALCCELGSIYCDPSTKYNGAGKARTAAFTKALYDLGYRTMVTCAYDKNDSPLFFERLGARFAGACVIPNDYLDEQGRTATTDIPGVWLYWDKKAMKGLAAPAP